VALVPVHGKDSWHGRRLLGPNISLSGIETSRAGFASEFFEKTLVLIISNWIAGWDLAEAPAHRDNKQNVSP
jgi:hypothetical protein